MLNDETYERKVRETLAQLDQVTADVEEEVPDFDYDVAEPLESGAEKAEKISENATNEKGEDEEYEKTEGVGSELAEASDPVGKITGLGLLRRGSGLCYPIMHDMSVGRSVSNDIVLDDPDCDNVSRFHASLVVSKGRLILRDKIGGSTNGTFVNGVRIDSREIVPGDMIRFADVEFAIVRI